MKTIINPWWIYFAEKSDIIIVVCATIGVIAISIAIGWYIVRLVENGHDDNDNFIQCPKWITTLGIICLIIGMLMPSQKTVLTMITIEQITPDNIKIVGENVTDVVDYITDKIKDIVDSKNK